MKLATQFKGTLVAIEEKTMSSGNSKYYRLAVLQGTEATSLSCTEEVYNQHKDLFKEYFFALSISEFEGKTSLRVTGIYDFNGSTVVTPGSAPADSGKEKK